MRQLCAGAIMVGLLGVTAGAAVHVVGLGAASGPYETGATDPSVYLDVRPAELSRRYKMWFEGRGGAGGQTSTTMFCTSPDGVTWSNFTPCTGLNAAFARVRIADPSVLLDQTELDANTRERLRELGYLE